MPRYSKLNPAEMSPAQKAVVDEIVSGKRGRFGGPFELLIRAPEVCKHLSRLGEYLRWGSSLSPALSELAICLTARHIRANRTRSSAEHFRAGGRHLLSRCPAAELADRDAGPLSRLRGCRRPGARRRIPGRDARPLSAQALL